MNNHDTRFANQYAIQWFPGHMAKTLRMMEQEIQHVDASLVLLDARIPLSSLNPEIERITARKPKLYALNKADLADPAVTEEWIRYFHEADAGCVAISAKQKGGANAVKAAIEKELSGLLARRQNRGMAGAKTQVMLCGIPNVGKSTFINTFAGSARAKAADRPGVTKGKQWVSTEKFDLLDMPGVLWKKFDSKTIASNLAFIGSIKDDILDVEELAMNLLDEVRRNYPDLVAQRYKLDVLRRDYPAARIDYNRLLELDPQSYSGRLGLATLEQKEGKFRESLEILNKMITATPDDATLYIARADVEREMKHEDLALVDLEEAIRLDAASADAYLLRGNIYLAQKKKGLAKADFEKAISLGVPPADLHEQLKQCK